jgi:hypothetical protein
MPGAEVCWGCWGCWGQQLVAGWAPYVAHITPLHPQGAAPGVQTPGLQVRPLPQGCSCCLAFKISLLVCVGKNMGPWDSELHFSPLLHIWPLGTTLHMGHQLDSALGTRTLFPVTS